ncbi:MAG: sugar ABC transporter permease [Burkholderiales bacterium PBB6]|nr:MAG: sugar ABC transporter permease [Burkholderiales bacterium PBB6]
MKPHHYAQKSAQTLALVLVLAGGLLMLAPFYLMFVFATHTDSAILSLPPPLWFGDALPDNLRTLMTALPTLPQNLGYSLYVALAITALNLFFCALAGHAFALMDFPGREPLFSAVLATMLLPAFLGMVPTVMTMSELGWMNTHRALIIPGACGAVGVFMMRQYVGAAVPHDLLDAARLDGCSEFGIFWRIVLPLVAPALGTLGLITFIGSWNNFIGPLVILSDTELYTLPLALRSLQSTGQTPWGALCAGAAMAVLPLMLIFMLASKRLIEGLSAGAVK